MKTAQLSAMLHEKVKPTTIESVKFRDGMLVTADDLEAGMRYSQSLLQTVLRAYFGCGVVCGLGLRVEPLGTSTRANWVVCIDRGVAVDCNGYPIELCAPIELDLSPDACDCDPIPDEVFIVVRRITSDEAPADPCSCDLDAPHFDCRRVRDLFLVQALTKAELEALPDVCRRPEPEADPTATKAKTSGPAPKSEPSWSEAMCAALTGCCECACGDSWILLGSVALEKEKGITKPPDMSGRRWVKPIEAVCTTIVGRIQKLEDQVERTDSDSTIAGRIKDLERKLAAVEALDAKVGDQTDQLQQLATQVSSLAAPTEQTTPTQQNAPAKRSARTSKSAKATPSSTPNP
jgi:hypothetical protein